MTEDDSIQIGIIINSHGVKGEVKVIPTTDDPELFLRLAEVIVKGENHEQVFSMAGVREVKNHWLILFDEVRDIEGAKGLKNCGIFVPSGWVRPLEEDEFFIHDLMDSKVYSTEDEYLGIITGYFDAGPQGICEVTGDDVFLFPTSAEILREVIPPDKVIIHLVPNLRELNRKKK